MFNPKNPYNNLVHLPPNINYRDPDLLELVISARTHLGELKGYSFSLPNPLLLLSPAIVKESLASSEIENVQTTIINVLETQVFPEEERREPDKEVLRYRDAIMWGYEQKKKLSLSTRLILGIQDKLMPESPKGYRPQQNAIQNPKTREIVYTPPIKSKISEYMYRLEEFMNNPPKDMDPIIACALSHYQFEAIHPFSDGNGRAGRILMVLQLTQAGVLELPILYISGYINENKSEYYQRLLEVTTQNKWKEYLEFMLKGFKIQASNTKDMIFRIMTLYWKLKDEIKKKEKTIHSADLIDAIFTMPVISPVRLAENLGCHYTTAGRYLDTLVRLEIMTDKKIGRYHLYANKPLLNILHKS
jgi:Fic family protein